MINAARFGWDALASQYSELHFGSLADVPRFLLERAFSRSRRHRGHTARCQQRDHAELATRAAIDFSRCAGRQIALPSKNHAKLLRVGVAFIQTEPASVLERAGNRISVVDRVEAAEALFRLWQGAGNFQLPLCIDLAGAETAVAERADAGIAIFMHAGEHQTSLCH